MCIYVRTVKNCDSIQNWMHRTRTATLGCNWIFTPHNLLLPESASNQRHGRDTPPFWAIEKHLHPFPPRVGWYAGYVFLPNIHISPSKRPSSPQVVRTSAMAFLLTSMAYQSRPTSDDFNRQCGRSRAMVSGMCWVAFPSSIPSQTQKTPVFPVELSSDPKFSE